MKPVDYRQLSLEAGSSVYQRTLVGPLVIELERGRRFP